MAVHGAPQSRQAPGGAVTADQIGAACRLISNLGHAGFMEELAREYASLYRAVQVTTFFIEHQQIRCALAYRPREPRLVERLCRSYTQGLFERDPVLKSLSGTDSDFLSYRTVSPEIYDSNYRCRFFSGVNLSSKKSIISRRSGRLLYVNFYFGRGQSRNPVEGPDADGPLLAELLHKHEALAGHRFSAEATRTRVMNLLRSRCPELSPRELQVCALIASGYSVTAIALELGIGEETVVTFRKRGYRKLRISSRGELFAHCAGLAT